MKGSDQKLDRLLSLKVLNVQAILMSKVVNHSQSHTLYWSSIYKILLISALKPSVTSLLKHMHKMGLTLITLDFCYVDTHMN